MPSSNTPPTALAHHALKDPKNGFEGQAQKEQVPIKRRHGCFSYRLCRLSVGSAEMRTHLQLTPSYHGCLLKARGTWLVFFVTIAKQYIE